MVAPGKRSLDLRGIPLACANAITKIARLLSESGCATSDVIDAETRVLVEAVNRARSARGSGLGLDFSPYWRVASNLSSDGNLGSAFRAAHVITHHDFAMTARELAFGEAPDEVREEYSRFCQLMYQGHQLRFLDRHPDETPEQFIDRPRKTTLNLTRRIINLKSQLYTAPPVRSIAKNVKPEIADAAAKMFANPFYNLALLEADRYSRLLGTVSVRPFYDPKTPGKIRLHVFMSHQLRVVLGLERPWEPLAVIERQNPYSGNPQFVIWTNRSVITLCGQEATGQIHGMGRIPHTFFRSEQSFSSFFVQGEGKDLAIANTTLNDKLSDLNEIIQFQGFSATEIVNPESDSPSLGPRTGLVFRPNDDKQPFGINFKRPAAPLKEMREDIAEDIAGILMAHGVPQEALGGIRGNRSLSGFAIQQLMQPIRADNKLRGMAFAPTEVDLSDSALRVLAEHDRAFNVKLKPDEPAIEMSVRYEEPPLSIEMGEQTARDELDLSYGITTPAKIMQRNDPARYPTVEEAQAEWLKNLEALRAGNLATAPIETPATGAADEAAVPPPRQPRAARQRRALDRLDERIEAAVESPVPGDHNVRRVLSIAGS